jgi:hypothetical protein
MKNEETKSNKNIDEIMDSFKSKSKKRIRKIKKR